MTAALESHSIGVMSVFSFAPKAFERSLCINLELLGWKKRKLDFPVPPYLFAFYTQCHGALGPDMFYHLSRRLAGYPFAFSKRGSSIRLLLRAQRFFPLSFIPNRIFPRP
jgi:hypothetical protein